MSERPTPETDEQINGKPCTRFSVYAGDSLRDAMVASEFARRLERERDEARETANRLNRRLQKAEGIIAKSGIVDNRPRHAEGRSLGRALANYAAEQYKRERDEALAVLSKIAGMDTSQLASPQQCGAVALAADYLSQLEDQSVDMLIAERKASDAAHKRIHDLSIENDNLKFELAQAVQARAMWQMKYNTTVAKMDLSEGGNKA